MAYEKALYDQVLSKYEQNRQDAIYQRNIRIAQVYEICPAIMEIDEALDQTGVAISGMILQNPGESVKLMEQFQDNITALLKQREQLLQACNLPPDYTDLQYTCSICKDNGYIQNDQCVCLKKQLTSAAYAASSLSILLDTQSFETFDLSLYSDAPRPNRDMSIREKMADILKVCKAFVRDFDVSKENLLFHGGAGLGKTFLSSAIARELIALGKSVVYQSAATMFSLYSDYKFGRIPPAEARVQLDKLFNCDLLIIDDLGTEAISTITVSYLFELLNSRMISGKKMIVSTNLTINELAKTYSERLHSRLCEHFTVLKFEGRDIRLEKMKNA